MWFDVGLILALVLINAAFAGSELALVSLREGQLRGLERSGAAGRRVAILARDPNRFLATIQIGITLAGFFASATAAIALSEPLVDHLGLFGDAAEVVAVVLVTLVLTYITLVVGELAPKRLAMQQAERWSILAAPLLVSLSLIARPAVWLLGRSTDLVVRMLGGHPSAQHEEMTEEEIRDLVATRRDFTAKQREIIVGALEIAERTLRQVMVPRNEVVTVGTETPAKGAVEVLCMTGHSRAPVIDCEPDDVVGVVHLADLIDSPDTCGQVAKPALVLPQGTTVLEALRRMQTDRQSLAIVLNEYGGAAGMVTIEDLIEELVGEIFDETDADLTTIRHDADGSVVVPGRFPVHDLVDVDVSLPEGEYATIAGLVLERLGHIPDPNEELRVNDYELTVLDASPRRIERVRIRRHA